MIVNPNVRRTLQEVMNLLRPPVKQTLSEWSEKHRVLSGKASAEPGKWRNDRAPFLREIMDCVTDDAVEEVVYWAGGQVGKTEVALNATGYFTAHEPSPILFIEPSLEIAKAISKDRLMPMYKASKVFEGIIRESRSRDGGNTLLHKDFPGGHVTLAGANSPASLASRPIRVLICDEEDSYDTSIGTEGDPVELAEKRTETFWNRKIIKLSTAKKPKGYSRIESDFERGDRRRYHVPCPHCGHYQLLVWDQLRWPPEKPEEAYYACIDCGCMLTDADKPRMLSAGEWRAEAASKGVASFHLNSLYSPWLSWPTMAAKFLKAKKSRETFITFVNLYWAATWKDDGASVKEEWLITRREQGWDSAAPEEVLLITAGVDVQDNRFAVELIGWGEGEESWSLDYREILADTSTVDGWKLLDKFLLEPWPHTSGMPMPIAATGVDTGHRTQIAYEFCATRQLRNVFALKGSNQRARPLITKPSTNNRLEVPLWTIGTGVAKENIMARLNIRRPEEGESRSGYCHFPAKYGEEYFKGLAAEERIPKNIRGVVTLVWQKKPGHIRNEPLDCRVYGYTAMKILNPNFEKLKAAILRQGEPRRMNPKQVPGRNRDWVPDTKGWLDR